MKIDLHCHSTCSDGTYAPTEVVQRAHNAGIHVLALNDHDSLMGIDEARAAADTLFRSITRRLDAEAV